MNYLLCFLGSAVVSLIISVISTVCIMNRIMVNFLIHQENEWQKILDRVLNERKRL